MEKRAFLALLIAFGCGIQAGFSQKADSTSIQLKQLLDEGGIHQNEGKIEAALRSYFTALRITDQNKDEWGAAITSERVAALYAQYYRYEESLRYLKTTHRYFQRVDSVLPLANVSNNIAWHFIKLNQIDSALYYAEESINSFRRLSNPPVMQYCIALESLGEIHSFKGNDDLAKNTLLECLNLGLESKNEVIIGFANYGLALNEFNHSRLATARHYISTCLPIADKYARGALLTDVYRLAYEIHEASGKEMHAYKYLKTYQRLRDTLYTQDLEKKAAIINANYEIQRKEAALNALKQSNSIQQLQIEQQLIIRNVGIGAFMGFILISILVYSRIQSKRKFDKRELERKNEELEQARLMQLSLLPQKPFEENGIEIVGKMRTATEVGGDYFDYFKLDNHRVLVAFGDATGHGMTAGMIVTITKVVIVNNLNQVRETNNLLPLARAINEALMNTLAVKGKGMSLQLAILDSYNRSLLITSCGMPYPMIYNRESNTFRVLEIRQPPLGFLKQPLVNFQSILFTTSDVVILVSDGILERFNRQKEEYGLERLMKHLQTDLQSSDVTMASLLNNVFTQNDQFAGGLVNHDDMTGLYISFSFD
jgi:serine phosphatase RsbU (regulator of sigma subunit)